jgi:hypothetical protein
MERALQHIEEARQLSKELGGTDKDVKAYFFSLPAHPLRTILDAYEAKYGREPREYAEVTLPKWRSGKVKMSGMVASRLFKLLPPRMPLQEKYKLTKNLWQHVGPSSRKTLRVGLDAGIEDALGVVRDHIEQVVVNYEIPESLERRFDWLSAGDVHVKQDLLNHLRQMEKTLVVEGAKNQLPVMLAHLNSADGQHTHRLAQVLKIGKHELEILVDKRSSGVKLEEPSVAARAVAASTNGSYAWVWWVAGILLVIFLLAR